MAALNLQELTDSIDRCFVSPNVMDSNGESANLVDVVDRLARNARAISSAITPTGFAPGQDAAGGTVGCLTEAVIGVTAGLMAIAGAIDRLADAAGNQNMHI